MRQLSLSAVLFGLLLCGAYASAEAAASPEMQISKTVPIEGEEIGFGVDFGGSGSIPAKAVFTIEQGGKELFRQEVAAADGKLAARWTPKQRGFFTASFEFGSESGIGKLSREFPVVWRELYFNTWGVLRPDEIRKVKYLCSHASVAYDTSKPPWDEAARLLRNRGAKLLVATSGTHAVPPEKIAGGRHLSDEEVDQWVSGWASHLKAGFDGVIIDEMGDYPTPEGLATIDAANRALAKLRKMYPVKLDASRNTGPDMIIMPWVGGAIQREEAIGYRQSSSIALLEVYPSYFARVFGTVDCRRVLDQRLMSARANDIVWQHVYKHGSIVSLGINVDSPYEEPTLPEAEKFVRYIKKTAPEMPGIAFYGGRINDEVLMAEDRFCEQYYVKPVVDIRQINFSAYTPVAGKPVDVLIGLDNLGGMDAKDIALRVYVAEVGTGTKHLIGEKQIQTIGCGVATVQKLENGEVAVASGDRRRPADPSRASGKIEAHVINGNTYYLGGEDVVLYIGRTTAKVTWTPEKSGSYAIIAEVVPSPSDQYTLLDGVAEERVVVK